MIRLVDQIQSSELSSNIILSLSLSLSFSARLHQIDNYISSSRCEARYSRAIDDSGILKSQDASSAIIVNGAAMYRFRCRRLQTPSLPSRTVLRPRPMPARPSRRRKARNSDRDRAFFLHLPRNASYTSLAGVSEVIGFSAIS